MDDPGARPAAAQQQRHDRGGQGDGEVDVDDAPRRPAPGPRPGQSRRRGAAPAPGPVRRHPLRHGLCVARPTDTSAARQSPARVVSSGSAPQARAGRSSRATSPSAARRSISAQSRRRTPGPGQDLAEDRAQREDVARSSRYPPRRAPAPEPCTPAYPARSPAAIGRRRRSAWSRRLACGPPTAPRFAARRVPRQHLGQAPIHHLDLAEAPTMMFDGFRSRWITPGRGHRPSSGRPIRRSPGGAADRHPGAGARRAARPGSGH